MLAVNKKGRILVVDDEPSVRELLNKVLQEMGHSVDVVSDAGLAMQIIYAGTIYDLILADIRMPGMNGVDLCTLILSQMPEMQNRIIVITGDVMGADIKEFLEIHKLAYIPKPFDIKVLKEQVQAVVNSVGSLNNSP
jgi:CheY-like chemotaxis protein